MATLSLPRRRAWASDVLAVLVVTVGKVIGLARRRSNLLPGLAGAALVAWGAAQVYAPAGWILGGVFLLMADRQINLRPHRGGE
jgi:hypothetical protein